MVLPVSCDTRRMQFGGTAVDLLVPRPAELHRSCGTRGGPAPYWARLWPAAVALCEYIAARPELVRARRVLELAAGLGLPGLLAAHTAAEVILSDIDPGSVAVMDAAAALSGFTNTRCEVIDWNRIPANINPEIVLLSDVNYDPVVFDSLSGILKRFLERGTKIILSTPQRLMAKPFIEGLLPWCAEQAAFETEGEFVSVFLLMQNSKFKMQNPG